MPESEKYAEQIKQALSAIKSLKAQLVAEQKKLHEPIAIVGMAMRLPGGIENEQQLLKVLLDNTDTIEDIPENRFDAKALYDEHGGEGKIILKQGGYLKNIDQFDASFFDITRVEAESLDPQQRLLLEVTYEALENAGIPSEDLKDSNTSVFTGITNVDYQKKHFRSGDYKLVNPYSYTGSAVCANSGRISYFFGLQGESVAVDTACSSSLVATHLAVQSLRNRKSDLAIVGAANLILSPELTITFTALNGLSPTSRCQPFSDNANGFVRSEGCAVIILKRLEDAKRDNNPILAVIKGTAVNQDGKSNGFTAPSVAAQTKLIQAALDDAQLYINDINYIEAHGTGTKIGDPIEIEAITNVIESARNPLTNKLLVGSVKSNIGHTESVAGLAGILKTIVSMQHDILPKSLHSETLNMLVDWNQNKLTVVQENSPWENKIKTVGISSFGVTGTNAHIILQNYTADEEITNLYNTNDFYLLPLSTKNDESLVLLVKSYISFIENSKAELADICATAALSRNQLKCRKLFVAENKEELIQQMKDFVETPTNERTIFEDDDFKKNVFVFPGQGAQWHGMGLQLIKHEPEFKQALIAYNECLKKYVEWDVFDVLNNKDNALFNQLEVIQPILVGISIALSELWKSKGVLPDAVLGHSLGEVAAAYCAGCITMDEAAKIITIRSRLMKEKSGQGLMLATDLSTADASAIENEFAGKLTIAVVNSKNSIVLSGDSDVIKTVATRLENENRFAKEINVDVASHSHHMSGIDDQLKQELTTLQPKNSTIQFYSTALNRSVKGEELDENYWKNNLRNTVRFDGGVQYFLKQGDVLFIEMSPHPTLLHAINENIDETKTKAIAVGSLIRDKDECLAFYNHIGKVFESNSVLNWHLFFPSKGKYVQLPNYAWQKERFWFDEQPEVISVVKEDKKQPAVQMTKTVSLMETAWKEISLQTSPLAGKKILLLCKDLDVQETFISLLEEQENEVFAFDVDVTLHEQIDFIICADALCDNNKFIVDTDILIRLQIALKQIESQKNQASCIALTSGLFNHYAGFNADAALLNGVFKSLTNENTQHNFKVVDIPVLYTEEDLKNCLQLITAENKFKLISLDNNKTYIQQLIQPDSTSADTALNIDFNKTIMVIGGTSGLGLKTAEWLSEKGATYLVLVSRSGEKEETKPVIHRILQNKTQLAVFKGDMSDKKELLKCKTTIENDMPPIGTVIHAAAVLQDRLFFDSSRDEMETVLQAKVKIAQHLHDVFSSPEVQLIFYSSLADIVGTMAQAVYSGSNYYLDNLTHYRKQKGLPTKTVNWGNIAEIGLAAKEENRGKQLEEQGLGLINIQDIEAYLQLLFSSDKPQLITAKINFEQWKKNYPMVLQDVYFENFIQENIVQITSEERTAFNQPNLDLAQKWIKSRIKDFVAEITKIPSTKLKDDDTFKSIGIDSLMALQLKNKIQSAFQLSLNVSSVWSYPTADKFTRFLSDELKLTQHYNTDASSKETSKTKDIEQEIKELSLEELMRLLNEKL